MVQATIQDLRVFQWGKETAFAIVDLTVDTQPIPTDTFTIGTTVYTFVASGAVAGQINVGANLAAAQVNIIAAINGTDGFNTPHISVVANAAFVTNILRIRARAHGTSYDSIVTTETFDAVTNIFSAATLTGGLSAGTPVPATSKMLVSNLDLEPSDQVYHPPLLRGLIQRWKGLEIVIERGTKIMIPDSVAFYEQLPNWLSMSVKGGVVPTGAGPYVYTFRRDPTLNPSLDTWTFERRLSDGLYSVDRECAFGMLSGITFKGAQNQPVMFTAEGFARRISSSSLTAAVSAPVSQALLSSNSKVYIDDTWGTLGATQIVGQILNWEIGWLTGYAPLFTTDGRADLDFTTVALSSENTQLNVKLTMLINPNNGQFAVEQAAAEATTLRAVRIQCDGDDASRRVRFDMLLKHNLGSLFKVGEFEGQDIVEMELVESSDGTNLFSVEVTSNIPAII
jgi:hypothetical protein